VSVVDERNEIIEHWWNDTDIVSSKYSERNLSCCSIVHYVSHLDLTEMEFGLYSE